MAIDAPRAQGRSCREAAYSFSPAAVTRRSVLEGLGIGGARILVAVGNGICSTTT